MGGLSGLGPCEGHGVMCSSPDAFLNYPFLIHHLFPLLNPFNPAALQCSKIIVYKVYKKVRRHRGISRGRKL